MVFLPNLYQKRVMQFVLETPFCAVLQESGYGRTVTVLTALQILLYDRFESGHFLIISSRQDVMNRWKQALEKWDHLQEMRWVFIRGSASDRRRALKSRSAIYFATHDTAVWLRDNDLWDFDCVVIDGLHQYKNHRTKRFSFLLQIRPDLKRLIALTHISAWNNMEDIWAQAFILDLGERLGSDKAGFYERFFFNLCYLRGSVPICRHELKDGAVERIRESLRDIFYIDDSAARYCRIKDGFYETVIEPDLRMMSKYEIAKRCGADTTVLMQMANGIIYEPDGQSRLVHDTKLKALKRLVSEMEGKTILVAHWFKHEGAHIKDVLPQIREIETYDDIRLWNEGRIRLGLLHAAHSVPAKTYADGGKTLIWFSLPWSGAVYAAVTEKMKGESVDRELCVFHLITKGTIDEKLIDGIKKKRSQLDQLVSGAGAQT